MGRVNMDTITDRNVTYQGRPAYIVGATAEGKLNLTVRRLKEERAPGKGPCYGLIVDASEVVQNG